MRQFKPILLAIALATTSLAGATIARADAPPLTATEQTAAQALAAQIESAVADAPHDASQSSIQLKIRELIRRSGLRANVVLAALNTAEDVVINDVNAPSFGLAAIQSVDTRLASLVGSSAPPASGGGGGGGSAIGGPSVGIGGGGSNYKP